MEVSTDSEFKRYENGNWVVRHLNLVVDGLYRPSLPVERRVPCHSGRSVPAVQTLTLLVDGLHRLTGPVGRIHGGLVRTTIVEMGSNRA